MKFPHHHSCVQLQREASSYGRDEEKLEKSGQRKGGPEIDPLMSLLC